MGSRRFSGFFRNAPFDKPGVLLGFLGFRPLFFHAPLTVWRKGGFGDYPCMEHQELSQEGQTLMDGMPTREFFSRTRLKEVSVFLFTQSIFLQQISACSSQISVRYAVSFNFPVSLPFLFCIQVQNGYRKNHHHLLLFRRALFHSMAL